MSGSAFTSASGPIAWTRGAFDLDAPEGVGALLDADRPEVVVHAAAWTDVDGCALDPGLAIRRNGLATGVLAAGPPPNSIAPPRAAHARTFSAITTNFLPW